MQKRQKTIALSKTEVVEIPQRGKNSNLSAKLTLIDFNTFLTRLLTQKHGWRISFVTLSYFFEPTVTVLPAEHNCSSAQSP